jgi:hypothetical protein
MGERKTKEKKISITLMKEPWLFVEISEVYQLPSRSLISYHKTALLQTLHGGHAVIFMTYVFPVLQPHIRRPCGTQERVEKYAAQGIKSRYI